MGITWANLALVGRSKMKPAHNDFGDNQTMLCSFYVVGTPIDLSPIEP